MIRWTPRLYHPLESGCVAPGTGVVRHSWGGTYVFDYDDGSRCSTGWYALTALSQAAAAAAIDNRSEPDPETPEGDE